VADRRRLTQKVGKQWLIEQGNDEAMPTVRGFVRNAGDLPGTSTQNELWFVALEGNYYVWRACAWTPISVMDRLDL
jgi:hypothetical protein